MHKRGLLSIHDYMGSSGGARSILNVRALSFNIVYLKQGPIHDEDVASKETEHRPVDIAAGTALGQIRRFAENYASINTKRTHPNIRS
jgi:hypothetical protein